MLGDKEPGPEGVRAITGTAIYFCPICEWVGQAKNCIIMLSVLLCPDCKGHVEPHISGEEMKQLEAMAKECLGMVGED